MKYGQQLFFSLFFFVSFHIGAQVPVANIGTTSESVIFAGATVQLDGTASTSSLYKWKLVRMPEGSMAVLSTPSLSMPSFTADRPGLYLVELKVGSEENPSSPEYLVVTAVTPVGTPALSPRAYSTTASCAFLEALGGCTESTDSFVATPGEYTLNVRTDSLGELSLTLNGEALPVPPLLAEDTSFSIAVTLKDSNQLMVIPSGELGSFATVEIVTNQLPAGMNDVPVVADLALSADNSMRMASGMLNVVDSDGGQAHTSEILSDPLNGTAYLAGPVFSYQGKKWFQGHGERFRPDLRQRESRYGCDFQSGGGYYL